MGSCVRVITELSACGWMERGEMESRSLLREAGTSAPTSIGSDEDKQVASLT